jgi:hypothetical protein
MVDYGLFFYGNIKKSPHIHYQATGWSRSHNHEKKDFSIVARKTLKNTPVKTSTAVAGTGKVKLTFEIDVNSLTLAPGGDYFNLPYLVNGSMVHGKTEVPAFISKGRVILPTAQGRAKRGQDAAPKAKSNAVDLGKLL